MVLHRPFPLTDIPFPANILQKRCSENVKKRLPHCKIKIKKRKVRVADL
jgi:hypothetical protein